MTVNSVDSIPTTISSAYTTTVTDSEDGSMYMDDFLTVFLAQLQYQDPLNPMEGTEMTTQLAQITSVGQQYNTNEKLDTISQELQDLSSTGLLQYIGKDVRLDDDRITVQNGEALSDISFSLEEAARVEITIYDSDGNEVRQIKMGETEAGAHQVEWDGKNSEGNTVVDGDYSYEVQATNFNGDYVTTQIETTFRITGVTYRLRLSSSRTNWARFIRRDFQFLIWLGWTWYCSATSMRLLPLFRTSLKTWALKAPL